MINSYKRTALMKSRGWYGKGNDVRAVTGSLITSNNAEHDVKKRSTTTNNYLQLHCLAQYRNSAWHNIIAIGSFLCEEGNLLWIVQTSVKVIS